MTKDDFVEAYNLVCTRVIGWGSPSPMLIPLVDFINFGVNREARMDFVQKTQSPENFVVRLAVSSNKRKINTQSGVQTDFGDLFSSSLVPEVSSSKLSMSDKIKQL